MQDIGVQVRSWLTEGRQVTVARVIDLQGFSPSGADLFMARTDDDEQVGEFLGRFGASAIVAAAESPSNRVQVIEIDIADSAVAEFGLSGAGPVRLIVQPAAGIPASLWTALAERSPVALITRIDGPTAGPASMVVQADGSWAGALEVGDPDHLAHHAVALFEEGGHGVRQIDDGAGTVLIEAWAAT